MVGLEFTGVISNSEDDIATGSASVMSAARHLFRRPAGINICKLFASVVHEVLAVHLTTYSRSSKPC